LFWYNYLSNRTWHNPAHKTIEWKVKRAAQIDPFQMGRRDAAQIFCPEFFSADLGSTGQVISHCAGRIVAVR
jgi:hypothetical protein